MHTFTFANAIHQGLRRAPSVELLRGVFDAAMSIYTIQTIEAAFRQYALLRGTPYAVHVLVAASRYLAAHSPTMRAEGQTFHIAQRLHRGEKLFEEA